MSTIDEILKTMVKEQKERADRKRAVDNKDLPLNDRLNNFIDKLCHKDIEKVFNIAIDNGYIYSDTLKYEDETLSDIMDNLFEILYEFFMDKYDCDKVLYVYRNNNLFELSIFHGQGTEYCISLVEKDSISDTIKVLNENIKDLEKESERLQNLKMETFCNIANLKKLKKLLTK